MDVYTDRGRRSQMEDRHAVIEDFNAYLGLEVRLLSCCLLSSTSVLFPKRASSDCIDALAGSAETGILRRV